MQEKKRSCRQGGGLHLHDVGQAALGRYVAVRNRQWQQRLARRVHCRLRICQPLQDRKRNLRLLEGAQGSCGMASAAGSVRDWLSLHRGAPQCKHVCTGRAVVGASSSLRRLCRSLADA